jgi:hypothetical protein
LRGKSLAVGEGPLPTTVGGGPAEG